jgi:hypothetical protein
MRLTGKPVPRSGLARSLRERAKRVANTVTKGAVRLKRVFNEATTKASTRTALALFIFSLHFLSFSFFDLEYPKGIPSIILSNS